MCSSATQSTSQRSRKSNRRNIDLATNADISDITIKIGSCSLILIHEDVLIECLSFRESPLSEQSVQKFKSMSEDYFTKVSKLNIGAYEMTTAIKLMDIVCDVHHLRLLATPIIIDGSEQRNSNGIQIRLNLGIGCCDISEVLKNSSIPILSFYKYRSVNQARSDVKIVFNKLQRAMRHQIGQFAPPKTDIHILLGNCEIEFDISIIDRLSCLFKSSPFIEDYDDELQQIQKKGNDTKVDLSFESSSVNFRLRFPIADLRPIHDPQRVPWWERNVRNDFLLFNFIQCKISIYPSQMRYEIMSNEIDIYYYDNFETNPNHLAKVKLKENPSTRNKSGSIEYPKIELIFPSEEMLNKSTPPSRTSDDDSGPFSSDGFGIINPDEMEQTPFTSKRIYRKSDTPHSSNDDSDSDILLIPGDRVEMGRFCDIAKNSAKTQVNITFPTASLQLK